MRRALNVLQACHAAYDVTDETAIYNCTGNPHPADIQAIVTSMMNDSFETSYRCELFARVGWGGTDAWGFFLAKDISTLKADKGLALQDIIAGIYDFIATIVFAPQTRVYMLDQLAQVECVSHASCTLSKDAY